MPRREQLDTAPSAPTTSGLPDAFSPFCSTGVSTVWKVRWSTIADGDTNTASATGGLANSPSTAGACSLATSTSSADGPSE